MKKEFTFTIQNPIYQLVTNIRMKKAIKKWNGDIGRIYELVTPEHDAFMWFQLVWQEIMMWISIADPKLPRQELDWLCERRGFSNEQKGYLIEMMRHVGMFK